MGQQEGRDDLSDESLQLAGGEGEVDGLDRGKGLGQEGAGALTTLSLQPGDLL